MQHGDAHKCPFSLSRNPSHLRMATEMGIKHEDKRSRPGLDADPAVEPAEEFEVAISAEGTLIFSWNNPDIQDLARLLGIPEFDPPRWCG